MKVFSQLLLYFGVFAILFWLFTQWDPIQADRVREISKEQEVRLGEYFGDIFSRHQQRFRDEYMEESLDILKQRLIAKLDDPAFEYQLYVLKSDRINAFVLPGGVIVIHTALLEFTESPGEVVAVLAHEIGHSELGHVQRVLAREIGLAAVTAAISGAEYGVLTDISRQLVSARFSRDMEREADAFALELMERAGVTPNYLAVFFHRLTRDSGDWSGRIDILSTHPGHEERRRAALEYEIAANFTVWDFSDVDWDKVRGRLAAGS